MIMWPESMCIMINVVFRVKSHPADRAVEPDKNDIVLQGFIETSTLNTVFRFAVHGLPVSPQYIGGQRHWVGSCFPLEGMVKAV